MKFSLVRMPKWVCVADLFTWCKTIYDMRNSYLIFLLFSFFLSCSKEDEVDQPEVQEAINFQLIGVNADAVFQYDHDGALSSGVETNLTNEVGVNTNYLTLRQSGSTLSFYSFSSGKFSLFQKNVATGEVQNYRDFYTNTSARSIVWGTNNDTSVFFGFYNPQGTTNLAIRTINLNTLEGTDLSLEFNINTLYPPLYHNGKLFITYKTEALEYRIGVYETATNILRQTLSFGGDVPSILIDHNGDLAVFKFSTAATTTLDILDFDTLNKVQEFSPTLAQSFNPGPMNAKLIDNKLYYEFEYSQPFSIERGPAIYDLETSTNTIIDLPNLMSEVEIANDVSIYISSQQYNAKEEVFLVSYGEFTNDNQLRGGAMVISDEGELVETVPLNFLPVYFIE